MNIQDCEAQISRCLHEIEQRNHKLMKLRDDIREARVALAKNACDDPCLTGCVDCYNDGCKPICMAFSIPPSRRGDQRISFVMENDDQVFLILEEACDKARAFRRRVIMRVLDEAGERFYPVMDYT